MLEIGSVI